MSLAERTLTIGAENAACIGEFWGSETIMCGCYVLGSTLVLDNRAQNKTNVLNAVNLRRAR